MRLITSLTTLVATTLMAALITACAGNAPRKPTDAENKNRATSFNDDCVDAYSRGAPTPLGCPQTTDDRRRTTRTAPGIDRDALPDLPTLGAPGGRVLGRQF
ncbi:MAG: hypothetical protein V4709_03605 [Pseudomonadota bacterium]